MGRARSKMELITEEKARIITFKRRKQGLIRKIHELTTLCDVPACVIIYGPNSGSSEPETWPEDLNAARSVVDIYRSKNKENSNFKTFGLTEFLFEREKKINDELHKQKKKNKEAKYPTRLESMSLMTLSQLRDFGATLKNKADLVKSRIEFMKQAKRGYMDYNTGNNMVVRPQMQVPNIYVPNTIVMPLENENYTNNVDVFGYGSYVQGPGFYDVGLDGLKPMIRYFDGAPYVQMGQPQQFLKIKGMMDEGGIYGAPYVQMGQQQQRMQFLDEGGNGGDQEGFRMGYNNSMGVSYH